MSCRSDLIVAAMSAAADARVAVAELAAQLIRNFNDAALQRLFDAIRPEQPLMRYNALLYADPTLHQPRAKPPSWPCW